MLPLRSKCKDQGVLESIMNRSLNYPHCVQLLKYKSMSKQFSSTPHLKRDTAFRNCFGCICYEYIEQIVNITDPSSFMTWTSSKFELFSVIAGMVCQYLMLLLFLSDQPCGLGKIAKLINAGKIDSSELITMKTLKVHRIISWTILFFCLMTSTSVFHFGRKQVPLGSK